ncbi:hypothetical protein AVEN_135495-1 [Araneus ventricosus]|uniref:Uncharacterized protein n=1 Tax=Araneus ventricosus TaxID=182803 RepID=A0A4Y2BD15_ARAVE|nr:hypothetical protein AVEN_135495-1 [Araneus ventricosus]
MFAKFFSTSPFVLITFTELPPPCHQGFLNDSRCNSLSTEARVLIGVTDHGPTPPEAEYPALFGLFSIRTLWRQNGAPVPVPEAITATERVGCTWDKRNYWVRTGSVVETGNYEHNDLFFILEK